MMAKSNRAAIRILPAMVGALLWMAAGRELPAQATAAKNLDDKSTLTLNLNNVPIDQLVKFLSDATGKPVIKQKDIGGQISVFSPTPVTRREAMELIYDALQLENIYVIEEEDKIQIVTAATIKTLQLQSLDESADMEKVPDSLRLGRKIYHLKNINATDIKVHLDKIIPDSAITIDARTNTLILTDQVTKLKRYDRIIRSLDSMAVTDRVIEVFQLKYADAIQLGILIGNILTNTSLFESTDAKSRGVMRGLDQLQALATQTRSRGATATSVPIMIGDVTMVPDPRTNTLIVSCPAKQMEEIKKLILDFDQEQKLDVQIRLIPILHIDARIVSTQVVELFRDTNAGANKDVVRVVPTDQGNSLLVYSSKANFDLIKSLVEQLDTEDAMRQETRSYVVENMEVKELSDQLMQLYTASSFGRPAPYSTAGRGGITKFIPAPKSNTLLVLAYPREFDFIEELIKALDIPARAGAFEPRSYPIKNTDANELMKTLQAIFSGTPRSMTEYYWRASTGDLTSLESMYGKVRFVVDSNTNTLVVIATNSRSYEIVEQMIKNLDRMDEGSSEVLVYELKYADAMEVADQLNNLLSDGAVTHPPPPPIPTPVAGSTSSYQTYLQAVKNNRDLTYPWQSAQATQRTGSAYERPINKMIGNVRVVPDTRANKVLVTAQPAYLQPLKRILETLDNEEPQVHIATRMIEMTRGSERRIGIRWTPDPKTIDPAELENAMLGLGRLGFLDAFGGDETGPATVATKTIPATDIGGIEKSITRTTGAGSAVLEANTNLALLLQLLIKNSKSTIISEPKLTVHNNETGNIFVGSEFPFRINAQTSSLGTQTFGIEYRKVGINLDMTPHINQRREIDLRVTLENSKIREGETVDGQIIKDEREFHTELALDNGQTMVIGGILLQDESRTRREVPILGKIPILKWAFGKTDGTLSTRELFVFITPEVLDQPEQAERLVEKSVEKLRMLDELKQGRTELKPDDYLRARDPDQPLPPPPPADSKSSDRDSGAEINPEPKVELPPAPIPQTPSEQK
ncbi:hypothetical protein HY256_06285 [Candidatus Sumerlaeota bacterium]|nr:hypothetical protein [Candidatus Sumerlaeota bacterium]